MCEWENRKLKPGRMRWECSERKAETEIQLDEQGSRKKNVAEKRKKLGSYEEEIMKKQSKLKKEENKNLETPKKK